MPHAVANMSATSSTAANISTNSDERVPSIFAMHDSPKSCRPSTKRRRQPSMTMTTTHNAASRAARALAPLSEEKPLDSSADLGENHRVWLTNRAVAKPAATITTSSSSVTINTISAHTKVECTSERPRLMIDVDAVTDADPDSERPKSSPPRLISLTLPPSVRHTHSVSVSNTASVNNSDDSASPVSQSCSRKRQRTSPSPPPPSPALSRSSSPSMSPINHRSMPPPLFPAFTYPLGFGLAQPSPSPLLRQLSLDSDDDTNTRPIQSVINGTHIIPTVAELSDRDGPSDNDAITLTLPCIRAASPALERSLTAVDDSNDSMFIIRSGLTLTIEDDEEPIVVMPYTPTPYPSPSPDDESQNRHNPKDGCPVKEEWLGVSTRRGVRKQQQDSYTVASNLSDALLPSLFGVFDGHGTEGGEVSSEASQLVPTIFFDSLTSSTSESQSLIDEAFDSAYQRTDHTVCEDRGYRGGSTACCAYVSETDRHYTLHVACVGDSRAMLVKSRSLSEPVVLSAEHSTSNDSEQARITAAGGHLFYSHCSLRVNGVLNVTRSIGDRALKQYVISKPETQHRDLTGAIDEYLLLMSDGISHVLSDGDIAAIVRENQHRSAWELSEKLVTEALDRGSKDNVTVVAIDLPKYLALRQQLSLTANTVSSEECGDNKENIANKKLHNSPQATLRPMLELSTPTLLTRTPSPSSSMLHDNEASPSTMPSLLQSPSPSLSSVSPSPLKPRSLLSVTSSSETERRVYHPPPAPMSSRHSLSKAFFAMAPAVKRNV